MLGVRYSFLFMQAQGQQLREIASLIESGAIRPVVDKVFPFEKTADALAYVETGRVKGKVVITVFHDERTVMSASISESNRGCLDCDSMVEQ